MRFALYLFLSAFVLSPAALAQTEAPTAPSSVRLHLYAGPTSLSLGQAGAFHQQVAGAYTAAGVRVPTQRLYPTTALVGADLLLHLPPAPDRWWRGSTESAFGLGVRYARSHAYSLYGDYAGTLDIVSEADVVMVEAVSRSTFRPGAHMQPFLGSRGGFAFGGTTTREEVDLGAFGASASHVNGSGRGFSLEGNAGVDYRLGPAILTMQAGYRYARVNQMEGTIYQDGQRMQSGYLSYNLDLSGWVITAGMAVPLW